MADMRFGLIAAATLTLTACGSREDAGDAPPAGKAEAPPSPSPSMLPAAHGAAPAAARSWTLQASDEGTALVLLPAKGSATIRLFCPARQNRLLVNIPGFRPIGSEDRLSFGSGGEVVALVADTRGDAQRGGVSGTGAVPDRIAALVGGRLSASYGAQTSGPHPAPPRDLARGFVAACREGLAAPAGAPSAGVGGGCLVQDGERLRVTRYRAIGTEPFWAARIEGRCVTYSHPENQDGTRIWTRHSDGPDGDRWSGALGGRLFELRIRPAPGCSDGMSDTVYPLAVDLIVGGERRNGCAAPL